MARLNLQKALASKITDWCQIHLISKETLENLAANTNRLPLPVILTLNSVEEELRSQMIEFLEKGGAISVFSFRKPPNFYLEAIDSLDGGLLPEEKINLVIDSRAGLPENIIHQFISVNFVSPDAALSNEKNLFFKHNC
ncbi:MAG: hypothetical protein ACK4FL_00955 [Microgenomates group bacterium]